MIFILYVLFVAIGTVTLITGVMCLDVPDDVMHTYVKHH